MNAVHIIGSYPNNVLVFVYIPILNLLLRKTHIARFSICIYCVRVHVIFGAWLDVPVLLHNSVTAAHPC